MPVIERVQVGNAEGLRVGRFPGKINTTSFAYRLGTTLIDTGPPNQWAEIATFAAEKPVSLVVATHHHEDHAGNLGRLARQTGAPALAPRESLEFLVKGFPIQPYRRWVWGRPARLKRDEVEPITDRIELADGGSLEPVLLPGHSPDMTCFLDRRNGFLFSADLYIARRLRYLRIDEDLAGMIASLEKIQAYDFDTLLCGHRGVISDGKQKLREKHDSLISLRDQARELHEQGLGVRQITRRLLGREGGMVIASLNHFSKKNLIRGCLAI